MLARELRSKFVMTETFPFSAISFGASVSRTALVFLETSLTIHRTAQLESSSYTEISNELAKIVVRSAFEVMALSKSVCRSIRGYRSMVIARFPLAVPAPTVSGMVKEVVVISEWLEVSSLFFVIVSHELIQAT